MTSVLQTASQDTTLTIKLDAIIKNYQRLNNRCPGAQMSAVVKANAYGTGYAQTAPALYEAGCRTFFVATLPEALALRALLPEAIIYMFNGLPAGQAETLTANKIRPVLGTFDETSEWGAICKQNKQSYPAALHFDTGMNRLGFTEQEHDDLSQSAIFDHFTPSLIMSHLACADTPLHPLNKIQLERFLKVKQLFPECPASLANSAGIFLGDQYHFDLVRPGISLYGGCPAENMENPMLPVAFLKAKILKVKTVPAGQNVGYGGICILKKETVVATLNVGYADGYHRALGATSDKNGASIMLNDEKCPLLGRVSMDLLTADITDCTTKPQQGDMVEIIGQHITIDDLAKQGRTISYEILTSLGARYQRVYTREKYI